MTVVFSDIINFMGTGNRKVATGALLLLSLVLLALYISELVSVSLSGLVLGGIIGWIITAIKLAGVVMVNLAFYKHQYNTMNKIIYGFAGFIVGSIIVAIFTAGVIRLFSLLPLIVEIFFVGLAYKYSNTFSKQILP